MIGAADGCGDVVLSYGAGSEAGLLIVCRYVRT
jgi:hypothetical protein